MGACTVTVVEQSVDGNKRFVYGRIAGSTSYAAGGETFTAASMGLRTIDKMFVTPSAMVSSKAFVGVVIPTSGNWPDVGGKLALVGASTAAGGLGESGAQDVSGFTFEFKAEGV